MFGIANEEAATVTDPVTAELDELVAEGKHDREEFIHAGTDEDGEPRYERRRHMSKYLELLKQSRFADHLDATFILPGGANRPTVPRARNSP